MYQAKDEARFVRDLGFTVDWTCRSCGIAFSTYKPLNDFIEYPLCIDCELDQNTQRDQEEEKTQCY
jgi:hypothetical protein